MEPVIGQGTLDDAVVAHPPVPFSTARRHPDLVLGDPQGGKVAATRARPFPLLPVIQPHSTAHPLGQCHHLVVGAADAEVVEPAGDIAAQFVNDVLHAVPPVSPCDLGHPLLEARVGLGGPHHPVACANLEAQKGALSKWRSFAFGPVDHQLEPSLDEPRQARHHP